MATLEPAAGRVNHAAERRRRSYAMLDAADPARGRAVRWCEWALDFRRTGDVDKARALLRDALACGAHPPTIYRAWIAMEEEQEERAADAIRELFEGWRAWYPAAAGADDEGGFWCHYIAFELRNCGGAARVLPTRPRRARQVRPGGGAAWVPRPRARRARERAGRLWRRRRGAGLAEEGGGGVWRRREPGRLEKASRPPLALPPPRRQVVWIIGLRLRAVGRSVTIEKQRTRC
jgi:hypothetical protein